VSRRRSTRSHRSPCSRRRAIRGWLGLAACLLASACRGEPSSARPLHVYAASSLTEAFEELALHFEQAHPGVDVSLTFAGSQVLRLQIEQGASADVYASANEEHVLALARSGDALAPVAFAASELVLVLPLGASPHVDSFEKLATLSRIVVGAEAVPVGAYTERMLERARATLGDEFVADVRRHIVSRESNVRLVRAKVEMGEADAAIVYRTDAVASGRVRVVELPAKLRAGGRYHLAALTRSADPALADEWVSWVRGITGRQVLGRHGFTEAR